jgi:hypothetical protein
MKLLRHSLIQVRIGITENNSHRPPELLQLKSRSRTGSYGGQQIRIQTEEGGTRAWYGVELLIQERHKFISNLGIPEESTDLPPIHSTEDQVTKHC